MNPRILAGFPICIMLLAALAPCAGQPSGGRRVDRIIQTIDDLYRSESSTAKVRMTIVNPHWERTLVMDTWSRGTEKTFIRILSPAKEEGVGTLRIGNEMWNYLPNTGKVIKIPPSMMMSSWMGSDFNNNDLVREYTFFEDYTFSLTEETPDSLIIECVPKPDRPIVWGKVRLVVRPESYLPIRQVYFDEHGDAQRILYYRDIRTFDGRRLPSVMELVPQNEKGRTVLTYESLDLDARVPDDVFTLRNLRTPRL